MDNDIKKNEGVTDIKHSEYDVKCFGYSIKTAEKYASGHKSESDKTDPERIRAAGTKKKKKRSVKKPSGDEKKPAGKNTGRNRKEGKKQSKKKDKKKGKKRGGAAVKAPAGAIKKAGGIINAAERRLNTASDETSDGLPYAESIREMSGGGIPSAGFNAADGMPESTEGVKAVAGAAAKVAAAAVSVILTPAGAFIILFILIFTTLFSVFYSSSSSSSGGFVNSSGTNTAIVEIAENEIGGHESRYQDWYGMTDEWCCMFVCYVLSRAGCLDNGAATRTASCTAMKNYLDGRNCYMSPDRTPQPGNLIFFRWPRTTNTSLCDHIGIVSSVTDEYIYVIHGNYGSDYVRETTFAKNSSVIAGYGIVIPDDELPEYAGGGDDTGTEGSSDENTAAGTGDVQTVE